MKIGRDLVRCDRRIFVLHRQALAEAGAIVQHQSTELSDRAGNQFSGGGIVAQAGFKDNRGSERARSLDVKILTVDCENSIATGLLTPNSQGQILSPAKG